MDGDRIGDDGCDRVEVRQGGTGMKEVRNQSWFEGHCCLMMR